MGKTSRVLVVAVLILLSVGIVILASSSSVRGALDWNDPNHFIKRQLIGLCVALLAGVFFFHFDYRHWQKLAVPVVVVSVAVLALVLVPGIGTIVNGSRRWLRAGPLSFQPSELAKFAVVVALAAWMSHVGRRAAYLREGLIYPIVIIGIFAGLTMLEPDFGTTLLCGAVGMGIMFAGGTRLPHLVVTGVCGMSAFALAIMRDPHRMGRILAFLMPEKYPAAAYHLTQSKIAFMRGGLTGVGLGNSLQKKFYLPEAHTDFILAIVGEELGIIATGFIISLFAVILVCGMIISVRAREPFGKLLGFGITIMITLQAVINVGVVTGCLPTKGLPLPFISYGGSSLLISVAMICVLLNIAANNSSDGGRHTHLIKDKAHQF